MGIDKKALMLGMGIGLLVADPAFSSASIPAFEGELKTQVEFREDIRDRDSTPFDTYLKLDVRDLKGKSELHFYGKLWKDLGRGTDWDADLFQLYVDTPLNREFKLSVGRQFISEGFETYIADAVRLTRSSKKGLRYVFYLGKPRYFEPNTRSGDDLLAGFKLDYKGFFLGFEHVRKNGDVRKSSFLFGDYRYLTRELAQYARLELDVAHGELLSWNLGIDYFPTKKLRLNSDLEFYDGSYTYGDGVRENELFYLFSSGRELRFTQSVYYDLTKVWQVFGSYTFTDLQRKGKDNGHLIKLGLVRDTWFDNGLRSYGSLLYQNSWFGIMKGFEVGFTKYFCRKLTLTGMLDVAHYDKITYGSQWSNALYLKGTYAVTEFSNFELGIDYRKNEDFDRDARVILRYNYLFWGGSSYKERRVEERK